MRINYAGCIGHLVRTARDSSREKLFSKLRSWYMDKEDEQSRAAVAFTFLAVTRQRKPPPAPTYSRSARRSREVIDQTSPSWWTT